MRNRTGETPEIPKSDPHTDYCAENPFGKLAPAICKEFAGKHVAPASSPARAAGRRQAARRFAGFFASLSVYGLIFTGSCEAQTMKVRDLQRICELRPHAAGPGYSGEPDGRALCEARILGEVDGIAAGQKLSHGKAMFCLPPGAGRNEKFRVVRQYMRRHPETMSVDVGWMVAGALAYAYPCPPSQK
jgi:hypothetical protein